jgi:hypothetical protein
VRMAPARAASLHRPGKRGAPDAAEVAVRTQIRTPVMASGDRPPADKQPSRNAHPGAWERTVPCRLRSPGAPAYAVVLGFSRYGLLRDMLDYKRRCWESPGCCRGSRDGRNVRTALESARNVARQTRSPTDLASRRRSRRVRCSYQIAGDE